MNKFRLILVLRAIVGTVTAMLGWRWWVEPFVASLDARWPVGLPSTAQWFGWPMMAGALTLIADMAFTLHLLSMGLGILTRGEPVVPLVARRTIAHMLPSFGVLTSDTRIAQRFF